MQGELSKLGSDNPDCIVYHSLGFKIPEAANLWIEENFPHGKYGLVVYFHMMMEHVEQKIKGVDVLEIHPENFFGKGIEHYYLEQISEIYIA